MQPTVLLKDFKLNHTKIREEILAAFLTQSEPLSASEIKELISKNCDRVTLYRNLKIFTDKGILHQIFINNQETKYVLVTNQSQTKKHYHDHIHFKCVKCELLKCLTDQRIIIDDLPDGFKMTDANFIVFGICKNCNK
jgi:Fur family transcriptional regulator, ferric uptake regulator